MSRGHRSVQTSVLAAASEAGSGKALAPVLQVLRERGVKVRAFLPAAVLDFAEWAWPGTLGPRATVMGGQSVEDAVGDMTPDRILVGTTVRPSLERELILYGRHRGIPSFVIVDERYGYRRRFADEKGDLCCVPGLIMVMDEECARDAVAEGIPLARLRVTGSPVLSYLTYQHAVLRERVRGLVYPLSTGWRLVTFISETFGRDNGRGPGQRGLLGSFLGFTEETVRRDVLDALREIGQPVVLLERLHPSDESEAREIQESSTLVWKQIQGGDLWKLLMQSDAVIGMRSIALLEAGLLGCRVASYQPNLIGENNCAAVRYGLAARLETRHELREWLKENVSAEPRYVAPPAGLPFIRADAADRVADLVLGSATAR